MLRKLVALPMFIVNYFVEFPSKVKSYENFGLRFTLKITQIKPKVHAKVMSFPYCFQSRDLQPWICILMRQAQGWRLQAPEWRLSQFAGCGQGCSNIHELKLHWKGYFYRKAQYRILTAPHCWSHSHSISPIVFCEWG